MHQFLDREKWKAHLDGHIGPLDDCKATKCIHPRQKCVDAFPSVQELKLHLQDIHCIELTKDVERRRSNGEVNATPARRKTSGKSEDHDPDVKLDSWPQSTH